MKTTPSNNPLGLSRLDRRISVVPMMDWTDEGRFVF